MFAATLLVDSHVIISAIDTSMTWALKTLDDFLFKNMRLILPGFNGLLQVLEGWCKQERIYLVVWYIFTWWIIDSMNPNAANVNGFYFEIAFACSSFSFDNDNNDEVFFAPNIHTAQRCVPVGLLRYAKKQSDWTQTSNFLWKKLIGAL